MVGINGKMANFALAIANAPNINTHMLRMGLALALLMRMLLLVSISWLATLTNPMVHLFGHGFSGRDLILLVGGLFLIGKSAHEIHATLEGAAEPESVSAAASGFISTLIQIAILDIVFSLDSVITAVGMADHVPVMVLAIMIAVFIMMFAAKAIGDFVDNHPTIKMLALSFLTLVGFALMAEGMDLHIPKGYIYFAMAFSLTVEMINIRLRSHHDREKLKQE